MYESDGSIMVYWHALDSPETPTGRFSFSLHHMHVLVNHLNIFSVINYSLYSRVTGQTTAVLHIFAVPFFFFVFDQSAHRPQLVS